ncbi:MAG: penicillin acylase family protein [Thermoanaerobaculales bacterium]|jgi:penicillin amidase|nr:penicillin acylase family protein [Thermoanaerobaculales bacterium]
MARWLKIALSAVTLILLVAVVAGLAVHRAVRRSLPLLDAELAVRGPSAPVTIERDALGVPTIRGADRADVAFGLGFVHAQERFFQMDLLRRTGAGELAGLVGPAALEADRRARVHRFRSLASEVLEALPQPQLDDLEAYVAGVNAGLTALAERPFEYLLLRAEPEPWTAEDSILVLDAMYFELNDSTGRLESARGLMEDLLPPDLAAFLDPPGTSWDAALDGGVFEPPAMPGSMPPVSEGPPSTGAATIEDGATAVGSNCWAVAGSRTADGRAIVADDMHLGLGLPTTWYRAAMEWPAADGGVARAIGVTLPGSPALVAGSNARVAWGFTNSYGDWSDLVVLESDGETYRTPEGPRPFEVHRETIEVRGKPAETLDVRWTIWGPVVDEDHLGRPRALRWVAHDPEGADLGLLEVEAATTVDEALAAANRTGIPPQNFICADAAGRIGWTIIGAIPARVGFSGRVPTSWADGEHRWNGWLAPEAYPRIVDPADGVLWTANNRQVSGEALAVLGDGGFDLGARAKQIRDGLLALEGATEADMLAIQLDDRALFLERWRRLALDALSDEAVAGHPGRRLFRELVEGTWTGRASTGSPAFRLVRAFRIETFELVVGSLLAPLAEADERFEPARLAQWEDSLWRLVAGGPGHLLPPGHGGWTEVLLAAVDRTVEELTTDVGPDPARWTWGQRNTVRLRHPLSLAVPALSGWLDMPPAELPGDGRMPRVQSPTFGASERFAVSPGREAEGYLHMPAGQSGHPLSPHYRAGHDAWVEGRPTPFLPGPTVSTLTLAPTGDATDG